MGTTKGDQAEVNWSGIQENIKISWLARIIGSLTMGVIAKEAQRNHEEWLNVIIGATYQDGDHGSVVFKENLRNLSDDEPDGASTSDGCMVHEIRLTVYPTDRPGRGVNPHDQALVRVIKRRFRSPEVVYAVHDAETGEFEYVAINAFRPSIVGFNIIGADGKPVYSPAEAAAACQPGGAADVFMDRFIGLTELLSDERE